VTPKDRLRVAGVHPDLIDRVDRVLTAMAALGFPMGVTDGVRTIQRQQELYAQGRTKPGPIVTNADGVTKRSNHQPHPDELGHAVDCAFIVDGKFSWDARLPWKAYGENAMAVGLKWGGDWANLHDLPHVELL